MSKTRISIKLNDYEYSCLYRVQNSCVMAGLIYDRAPQLNEIIKGLISYVAIDISSKSENLNMLAMKIRTYSEYPQTSKHVLSKVPSKSGNYIFIADDEDLKQLEKIRESLSTIYNESYEFPRLIRYCIHYTLYGDDFYFTGSGEVAKKGFFVLGTLIGNLYKLAPRTVFELLNDRPINWRKFKNSELESIRSTRSDLTSLVGALKLFVDFDKDGKISAYHFDSSSLAKVSPSTYAEYNSVVSDFNFLSVLFGSLYVTYMWKADTFDPAMPSVMLWGHWPIVKVTNEENDSRPFKKGKIKESGENLRNNFLMSPIYYSQFQESVMAILDIFSTLQRRVKDLSQIE